MGEQINGLRIEVVCQAEKHIDRNGTVAAFYFKLGHMFLLLTASDSHGQGIQYNKDICMSVY